MWENFYHHSQSFKISHLKNLERRPQIPFSRLEQGEIKEHRGEL